MQLQLTSQFSGKPNSVETHFNDCFDVTTIDVVGIMRTVSALTTDTPVALRQINGGHAVQT
jgi:hypothetical protein